VRYVLLVVVGAFPLLFGVRFTVSIMSLRAPTPPGMRGGRTAAVTSGLIRALTYAGLAFAVGVVLHQALNESRATAAALAGGLFMGGALSAPAIVAQFRKRAENA